MIFNAIVGLIVSAPIFIELFIASDFGDSKSSLGEQIQGQILILASIMVIMYYGILRKRNILPN